MAKTAAPKRKVGSIHSRAAKRASSPSIDVDKSIKSIKPPVESSNHRPSVLAIHQGAGVTKKSKNGRKSVLSAKAKRRMEKGMDMAEAVMDRKEKTIEKSRARARNTQDRAKAWDEHNKKMNVRKAQEEALAAEKENWVDEEDDDGESGKEQADEVEEAGKLVGDVQITDTSVATTAVSGGGQEVLVDEMEEEVL